MVISRFEERRFSDEVQSTRSSIDDGYVHDDGHGHGLTRVASELMMLCARYGLK